MTGDVTMRLVIKGRVQGVGYRAWCQDTAQQLGLTGWVRNLHDGSVEALAHGPAETLNDFIAACRSGPAFSKVSAVESTPVPAPEKTPTAFEQLPTA